MNASEEEYTETFENGAARWLAQLGRSNRAERSHAHQPPSVIQPQDTGPAEFKSDFHG